jgi:hypothetical protein
MDEDRIPSFGSGEKNINPIFNSKADKVKPIRIMKFISSTHNSYNLFLLRNTRTRRPREQAEPMPNDYSINDLNLSGNSPERFKSLLIRLLFK